MDGIQGAGRSWRDTPAYTYLAEMPDFQTLKESSVELIATTEGGDRCQTTPDRARPPDFARANTSAYTSLAKMAKNPTTGLTCVEFL